MSHRNGITEGVIWKQLLIFFFPILIGTFFQQLYNTTDAVIVGNYVGKEALAAVGATGNLINLLVGFFVGLSSGATVIISQFFGAKDHTKVSKAVHTSIALSIVSGLIMMFVGILIAPSALKMIGVPADIFNDSLLYTRIYFLGMIASLLYNMGAGILRAVGDSKRPLYFLILSCFMNIVLDMFFVVVLDLAVLGVSLATVLSQIFSAALVMGSLLRTKEDYKVTLSQTKFTNDILIKIVQIGVPAGLQSVLYSISNLIIQSNVNAFGTNTIAAWSAYGKIDGLFWMIMGAFGVAITTFVGQNFGAQKYERMRKSVKICILMAISSAVLLSVLLHLFGGVVFRLFTDDTTVIEKGIEVMGYMTPYYFTYVCVEVLSGAIRGTGDSFKPMIITSLGICCLRFAWVLGVVPIFKTLKSVVLCYPVSWSATSIIFIIYYLRGNWLKRRIQQLGYEPEVK